MYGIWVFITFESIVKKMENLRVATMKTQNYWTIITRMFDSLFLHQNKNRSLIIGILT